MDLELDGACHEKKWIFKCNTHAKKNYRPYPQHKNELKHLDKKHSQTMEKHVLKLTGLIKFVIEIEIEKRTNIRRKTI